MMPEKYGTITILRIQGSAIKLLGTLLVFSFSSFYNSIHFFNSFSIIFFVNSNNI